MSKIKFVFGMSDGSTIESNDIDLPSSGGGGGSVDIFKVDSISVNTSWASSSGYYYKDIAVTGLLDTDSPIVDCVITSDMAAKQESWAKIYRIVAENGNLRLYATSPTSVSLTLKLVSYRVSELDVLHDSNIVVTGGWQTGSGYWYKSVNIDGIKSTDTPILDCIIDNNAEAESIQNDWSSVYRVHADNNNITLYSTKYLSNTFKLQVLVIRG